MKEPIKRLQKAAGPDRQLDAAIAMLVEGLPDWCRGPTQIGTFEHPKLGVVSAPRYTGSIDAAMLLLPPTAVNHDLFSFGGHGEKHITGHAWGFCFHDTAQLVGPERAKAEVRRLRKGASSGSVIRGAPREMLERAIAEQFMEFYASHAATPAIAISIAALKARQHSL